jgi:hypothetical protein
MKSEKKVIFRVLFRLRDNEYEEFSDTKVQLVSVAEDVHSLMYNEVKWKLEKLYKDKDVRVILDNAERMLI